MENEIKLTLEQEAPAAPTLTLEGAEPEEPQAQEGAKPTTRDESILSP